MQKIRRQNLIYNPANPAADSSSLLLGGRQKINLSPLAKIRFSDWGWASFGANKCTLHLRLCRKKRLSIVFREVRRNLRFWGGVIKDFTPRPHLYGSSLACNCRLSGWKIENGKLTIPRHLREREEFQVESVSLKLRNSGVGLLNEKLAYSLNHSITCSLAETEVPK